MAWSEIKNALNSTVGTDDFRPLDDIVRNKGSYIYYKTSESDEFKRPQIWNRSVGVGLSKKNHVCDGENLYIFKVGTMYITNLDGEPLKTITNPGFSDAAFVNSGKCIKYGKIYCIYGTLSGSTYYDTLLIYDIESNTIKTAFSNRNLAKYQFDYFIDVTYDSIYYLKFYNNSDALSNTWFKLDRFTFKQTSLKSLTGAKNKYYNGFAVLDDGTVYSLYTNLTQNHLGVEKLTNMSSLSTTTYSTVTNVTFTNFPSVVINDKIICYYNIPPTESSSTAYMIHVVDLKDLTLISGGFSADLFSGMSYPTMIPRVENSGILVLDNSSYAKAYAVNLYFSKCIYLLLKENDILYTDSLKISDGCCGKSIDVSNRAVISQMGVYQILDPTFIRVD